MATESEDRDGADRQKTTIDTGGPLRVTACQVYRGPNPYGYRPVVRFRVDLGGVEAWPSDRIPGFTDRLLELVPTLQQHGCSYGEPGGFVRRLREGTWVAHVAEHVALELQVLAGARVTYGKTRSAQGEPEGVYDVVYSYEEEPVGRYAGLIAVRLVDSLLPDGLRGAQGLGLLLPALKEGEAPVIDPAAPFDFAAELAALKRLGRRASLGPTTQSLVDEARRRGIPVQRLDELSLVQLGYGRYQQRIRASTTSRTGLIAADTAQNKELTSRLLRDAGIPVPEDRVARSADEAARAARKLGFPLVVKPLDGNHGRGVALGLTTEEEVRAAFEPAAKNAKSGAVKVERFFAGADHRILVVGGRMVAAAKRLPARVVGDGARTVAQLVEEVNRDPRRGDGHENVLTKIKLDACALRLLEGRGMTAESVPAAGEAVMLQETANLSTGGTAVDVTDAVHPDNRDLFERAALVIGLDVAGLDVITPDITKPLREVGGGIIEVNAGPGFRMHLEPSEGKRRNVARPVIDLLFPKGVPCRMPIVSITGTNGKTTTSRMVAHILERHGLRVGLTTSTGIYIGERLVQSGDTTGPKSARAVLRDPTIEAAVLETARGGILREGLGFDRCDVGAVLNLSDDHLGVKGVETVEDMARIKRLVVEVVERDGASVLNADDPLVAKMRRRAGGRLIYFSMHGGSQASRLVREHVETGGTAVVREDGIGGDRIVVYEGGPTAYRHLMWAHEVPATLNGAARFNIENALAATAIGLGLGIPADTIREALATFVTDYKSNPGRLNVYDGLPFRVILDYAHNPAGMAHIAEMLSRMKPKPGKVIGVTSGTGDRRDEDIRRLGAGVAKFVDELIVKETTLMRGRKPGEVPLLVREGAIAGGLPEDRVFYVEHECAAVKEALRRASPGDLVIVFCDNYATCWDVITEWKPEEVPARRVDLSELDQDEAADVGAAGRQGVPR
jgi:cyanophycin synthetase